MKLEEIIDFKAGAERVKLDKLYEWILTEMSYEDFCNFAVLRFVETNRAYAFGYQYMVSEKRDCRKAREEYLKYLGYKLIQNLDTPGVRLREF